MNMLNKKKIFQSLFYYFLLICVVIWSIIPIYFVVSSSFKIPRDIFGYPPSIIPVETTLSNYVNLFIDSPEFMPAIRNSGIVALSSMLLTIVICLPAAYVFSRYKQSLFRQIAILLIAIRMFPPLVISVPLFPILNQLKLSDNQIILIILYTTFEVSIITLILKSFIDSIPFEVEEAAYIDGARMDQVFFYMILPLSKPVLVGISILVGTYAWNEFQFAFLFTSVNAKTTPVLIGEMVGALTGIQWGILFAASVVQFIPALLFLWIIQNQLIHGMAVGAIKG